MTGPRDGLQTGPQDEPEDRPEDEPRDEPHPQPPADGSGSFYGWVWRHLPGSWPARVAILAVAAAVVVVLLFAVVFPWVEPRLPFNQVTVGGG
ncbi:MAG: hypothetical protein ACHQE5_02890 [Actinomycetes bacterium]